MQIGRAIASTKSPEKKKKEKKKSKPTEKYNITPDFEKFHFYKNGNIITKKLMKLTASIDAKCCHSVRPSDIFVRPWTHSTPIFGVHAQNLCVRDAGTRIYIPPLSPERPTKV